MKPQTDIIGHQNVQFLTKRELFAAMLMAAYFSTGGATVDIDGERMGQRRAINSIALADALLAELSKDQT